MKDFIPAQSFCVDAGSFKGSDSTVVLLKLGISTAVPDDPNVKGETEVVLILNRNQSFELIQDLMKAMKYNGWTTSGLPQ